MGAWNRSKAVWENEDRIMMLELSQAEKWCIATLLTGFRYAFLKLPLDSPEKLLFQAEKWSLSPLTG
jgi:hypothetical protein